MIRHLAARGRRYLRFEAKLMVSVSHNDEIFTYDTRDVSATGLFIAMERPNDFNMGEVLDVMIIGRDNKLPWVQAKVVRVARDGIAVDYVDHAENQQL